MARIRTIKPEFWQNEQLASLSEHARLLAIALLNHADDEGYFLANQSLVRAACFPFEEHSKKVLGSIQELSSVGYIEVRECSGKSIGFICKFSVHQRIDKPQKSKLSTVFQANPKENKDSENIPGTFQEGSKNIPRLERKGKEQGNGMEKEKEGGMELSQATDFSKCPDSVEQKTWENWLDVRKRKKAGPVTESVLAMLQREATKAGVTLQEAVFTCAGKNWINYDATWVAGKSQQKTFAQLSQENTQKAISEFTETINAITRQ